MMLVRNKGELQKLLNIVGDYALQFQIVFAGHKSCVIPLGEPVKKDIRWKLGAKYVTENEKEEIFIEEENTGRYLGVTIQKNYNNLNTNGKLQNRKQEGEQWWYLH